MQSVFNPSPIDVSPCLHPTLDQSPSVGNPSRSPPERGLIAIRRQLSGLGSFFTRRLQSIRIGKLTNESENNQENSGSPIHNGVSSITTVAGILGIPQPGEPAIQVSLSGADQLPLPLYPILSDKDEHFTPSVLLSALEYVPGVRIKRYLGRLNIHLIKESTTLREQGGLGSFFYTFLLQAQAIARAHVGALGGNALISFRMKRDSGGLKNQAYNLISLSGDAVLIETRRKN